jgi:hypothetical protein
MTLYIPFRSTFLMCSRHVPLWIGNTALIYFNNLHPYHIVCYMVDRTWTSEANERCSYQMFLKHAWLIVVNLRFVTRTADGSGHWNVPKTWARRSVQHVRRNAPVEVSLLFGHTYIQIEVNQRAAVKRYEQNITHLLILTLCIFSYRWDNLLAKTNCYGKWYF